MRPFELGSKAGPMIKAAKAGGLFRTTTRSTLNGRTESIRMYEHFH